MSFRLVIVLFLEFIVCSSLGADKQPQKNCDFLACGKFEVEESHKGKLRCLSFKTVHDRKAAPLVEDIKCTMLVSRLEKKKRVHYLVITGPKHCELKKGDSVEMRLREGNIARSSSLGDPCPKGTNGFEFPEDNPPVIVDDKEMKALINVDFWGI